jgi:hypothetical protein
MFAMFCSSWYVIVIVAQSTFMSLPSKAFGFVRFFVLVYILQVLSGPILIKSCGIPSDLLTLKCIMFLYSYASKRNMSLS